MKFLSLVCLLLLAVTGFCQAPDPNPPAEMKILDSLVGTWKTSMVFALPGVPEEEIEGTTTIAYAIGGRYIESNHSYKMFGLDMKSRDMWTYDPLIKKWRSYFFDNTGSEGVVSQGTEDKGTFVFTSEPISMGGAPKARYRSPFVKKSDKELTMTIESEQGSEWVKFITGTYTKVTASK